MMDLPQGWMEVSLAEVGQWGSGGTPKRTNSKYFGGNIPWLVIGDLTDSYVSVAENSITDLGLSNSSAKLLDPGTLLVAMYGSIGKLGITAIRCATNQAIAYCKVDDDVADTKFLFYALKHYKSDLESEGKGGTQQNISQTVLKSFTIALPPLNEQKRIADKLDRLLARVDAAKARLDKIPALLKCLRQSILASAISGALTEEWRERFPESVSAEMLADAVRHAHEAVGGHKAGNAAAPSHGVHDLSEDQFPDGWRLVELRDVVVPERPICYGILMPGPELAKGVPYVRVADFPNDRLNLATIRKTSPEIDADFKRSRLNEGDILLSIRGTVGRLVVVPAALHGGNITQDTARLSIQSTVNRDYVLWFLRSDVAQSRMGRAVKGVAVRGINIGDVRALQIPLPSRDEQNEIVRRVEELFAIADRIEAQYQAARARVDRLTQSLLAKAFRGELVPRDPNDEPASMLLERIRAQRADAPVSKRARLPAENGNELPMVADLKTVYRVKRTRNRA
jgi:type I restriction enzyme S subunit